jgi:uncharacterized alpha-E superfamily protein
VNDIGGAADYYQWGSLLRSISGFEAYRKIYRDVISPLKVAELFILRDDMPRSLHACFNEIETALTHINGASGREVRRLAGEIHAHLHFGRIDDIYAQGLHEYLTTFLASTDDLGREIRSAYLSRRPEFGVNNLPKVA